MVTEFTIKNFKSISDLTLDLGRVNVFIGENGSGKSNILEAIAIASALNEGLYSDEILVPRGVRMPEPNLQHAAFTNESLELPIVLAPRIDGEKFNSFVIADPGFKDFVDQYRDPNGSAPSFESFEKVAEMSKDDPQWESPFLAFAKSKGGRDFRKAALLLDQIEQSERDAANREKFNRFMIYSPENTALRTFKEEDQTQPLGIHGQGLFKLLKKFASQPNTPDIKALNERLQLFGWFDSFELPEHLWPGESYLKIKDKYLKAAIDFIDQRSANEGFLFALFYFSLFLSKETPKFFAIDNIEASLNPKMCTKIMLSISEMVQTHDKQVIVTTHNPSILDGIDLNDDAQRLFLIYRNQFGHTVAKRIHKREPLPGQPLTKLSEAFLNGALGGLPKNFAL